MKNDITKEEFITGYCERSEITRKLYDEWFAALPCACDYAGCTGWATVSRGGIKDHMALYAPRDLVYEEG